MSRVAVLDASVLVQAFIAEENTPHAQAMLAQLRVSDPYVLHIPEFCILECGNIFWKHVQFYGMALEKATRSIEILRSLPFIIHPVLDILPRALAIGAERRLAVYDALYIALAEKLMLPLITDDHKQANVALATGVSLKAVTDFRIS